MNKVGEQAVVLGGSMAGLLAARVLADAYDHVTIVERDRLPDEAGYRRGVPQGRHAHGLLPRGAQIMDELFPGLLRDVETGGVPVVHDFTEFRLVLLGHPLAFPRRLDRLLPVYLPSRAYLESTIRSRVRSLANVDIVERCDVVSLATTPERDRITGVHVSDHDGSRLVRADLVVDALGRGSRTPAWLDQLGYGRPVEDRVRGDVRYASLLIRPGALREKVVNVGPVPSRPTGMGLTANEDDTWMLTVGAMAGHPPPPTELDRMVEFITGLAPAHVVSAIAEAEPLTAVATFHVPDDRWRRYDKLRRFPEGFLVVGDAVCTFNPIYAQGMTVAALEALALRDCLRRGTPNLARRYFPAAAKRIGVAWVLATGGDLMFPEVPGPRPLPTRLGNAYLARYAAAAEHDTALGEQLYRVIALVDPPTRMFRPSMLWRVVRGNAGRQAVADARPAQPSPTPRA